MMETGASYQSGAVAFRAIWGAMPLPRDWRGQTKGTIRAPIPKGAPQRTREHGKKARAKGKKGRRR